MHQHSVATARLNVLLKNHNMHPVTQRIYQAVASMTSKPTVGPTDVSQFLGLANSQTAKNWESRGPSSDGLVAAAERGISMRWMKYGEGSMTGDSAPGDITNVEPAPELKKARSIPVTGSVRAGPDGYLVQDNTPDGWVTYWTGDPRAYALRIKGDSMHPRYRAGEFVVVTPSIEAQPGRDVVVKLHDGNCVLKQLNWVRGDELQLLSINNGYEPMTIGRQEIDCVERVAGSVGPDSMVF